MKNPACSCSISNDHGRLNIDYCPMHAAAPKLLDALNSFDRFLKVELDEMGNVPLSPRTSEAKLRAVHAMRTAIEKAKR